MDHPAATFDEDPPPEPRDGWLLVRIHVPELNVYKCLQFPSERLVWDVKQQVLASLPKELKESFNYGLFCPPLNGKAGKFLDEERRLGDYPFNGPVGYLELKYKRRVYKMLNLDEKQLKAVHTRANLRRFLECINGGHVDKIAKMCAKGLDPNFHCPDTGDTPLAQATGAKKPNKLLIALVNGGALLDYRTRDGSTALHRAVERDCLEAVTTLLELGASPNYKDSRGLTPLYLSVTKKTDSKICESLLHDHGTLGIQDTQGWQEVHQACRHGLVQHLEHLLFYGADMDGHNASGNTSLHVCAVNNQEACARMLLFRGAQRGALNYANQTPYQVAVIAGNMELAEMIQNYKQEDIVPFRGPPRYNPRRRSGIGWGTTLSRIGGPPSPCPSEHPFSSASSSLSEGSSSHRSHEDDISIVTDKSIGDTSDIISDSSGVGTNSDSAACSIGHPSTTVVCMQPYTGTSLGHLSIQPGDVIDVVGSTDCGLLEGFVRGVNRSGFFPEHCVQEVNIRQKNIHNVSTAATSASTATTAAAVGEYRGTVMMQPQQQQPNQHQPSYSSATAPRIKKGTVTDARTVVLHRAQRGFGFILRGAKAASPLMQLQPSDRCPGLQYLDHVDPGGVADMAGLRPGDFLLEINGEDVRCASHEQVVDLIRNSKSLVSMTVISQNFPNNFQHQIQSQQQQQQQQQHHSQSQTPTPTQHQHHSQNSHNGSGISISSSSAARQCATLPRKMPLGLGNISLGSGSIASSGGGRSPAPQPPRRDPKTTLSVGRARAKSMVAGLENGGEKGTAPNNNHQQHHQHQPNAHYHYHSTTTTTTNNNNNISMHMLTSAADDDDDQHDTATTKSSSAESIHQHSLSSASTPTQTGPGTPVQPRTASIKARPTSSRITTAELEELFQRQQGECNGGAGNGYGNGCGTNGTNRYSTMMTSSRFQSGTDSGAATPPAASGSPLKAGNTAAAAAAGGIVYASVADMKRKKAAAASASSISKTGTLRGKPVSIPVVSTADLKRTFHSTPDLAAATTPNGGSRSSAAEPNASASASTSSSVWCLSANATKPHRSHDDMHQLQHSQSMQRLVLLPPPTHPPPPPPVGQLVKVDVSRGSEYESTVRLQKQLLEKRRAEAAAATTEATASAAAAAAAAATAPATNASSSADDSTMSTDEVRSSFKPATNAKLYASPQDMRTVGFRSKVTPEPANAVRHQLRKSMSLRSDTDAPPMSPTPITAASSVGSSNSVANSNGTNSYAAPGYATSAVPQHQHQQQQQQQQQLAAANRCHTMPTKLMQAPPIPDPDYSLSESDGETENSILVAHNTKMNAQISGSSLPMATAMPAASIDINSPSNSGGSMSHSFSVDEIQKMRVKLKSSKSMPTDLLLRQQQEAAELQQQQHSQMHLSVSSHEEGDNSSSGFSSDQDLTIVSTPSQTQQQQQQLPPPPPILKTSQAYQQLQHSGIYGTAINNSPNASEQGILKKPLQQPQVSQPQQQQPQQQQPHQHHHHHHHHHSVKTIDMDREAALQAAAAAAAASTKTLVQTADLDDDEDEDVRDRRDHLDMDSPSPPSKGFQRHNSLTRKQAASIALNRALQSRTATVVSLVKLPPPIESDDQDEPDHHHHHHHHAAAQLQQQQQQQQQHTLRRTGLVGLRSASSGHTQTSTTTAAATSMPPGPMPMATAAAATEHIVLAPPPQFCDCVHTSAVAASPLAVGMHNGGGSSIGGGSVNRAGARIVGALPK